jgi:hypothetical protein
MGRWAIGVLGKNVVACAMAAALVMSAACSGDEHPPSGGVTCAEACARCSVTGVCDDCAGSATRFRDEFEAALYACVMQQDACSHDWEICVSIAITSAPPRDLDRTFRDACLARRTDCQNQGMGFADDPCLTSGAFTVDVVNQAQQCLALACGEVSACFHDVFE